MSEEAVVTQAETPSGGPGEAISAGAPESLPGERTDVAPVGQTEAVKSGADQESSVLTAPNEEKETPKEAEKPAEEAKPETRAPEEYSEFALPDGMTMEGHDLDEFKSFAKEQDLTQEQAQKVLDFAGPKIKEMIEQPYKAWKDLTEQWWNKTKEDPEIGGTKLEQSIKDAGQAFVPGESNPFLKTESEVSALREALKTTGAMHHPEVQRLFVRMGKMLAEPAHLTGKAAPRDKQQSFYNSMYPTMAPEGQG
jgi:hypothetical protein